MLRFEAITHNTKQLRCGRVLDRFGEIGARLAGMDDRFTTTLDCVDIGFLPDDTLDQLPLPSQIGATRVGGIDLTKPRIRTALSTAPGGFTVTDLAARAHTITGNTDYTTRHAADDLRKLRGKELITKLSRSHRYQVPPPAARTLTALLTLREQVIAPILAGVRSPWVGRKPATWTRVDRDYETLRINMQTLFHDLGITTEAVTA